MKKLFSHLNRNIPLTVVILFLLVSCQGKTVDLNISTLSSSAQPSIIPTDPLFPQQSGPDMYDTVDELVGKLVLVDGCLRLENTHRGSYLVIWSRGYRLDRHTNPMQIYNDSGQAVAQIGDYLQIAGGETSSWDKLPDDCSGPYWLMSSSMPTLVDTHFPQAYALIPDPATDTLTGKLVVVNGCVRLQTVKNDSFLIIWPWSFSVDWGKEPIQIQGYSYYGTSGTNDIVGQVGKEITVEGQEILLRDLANYTIYPIPDECSGPYWNVVKVNSPSPNPSHAQMTETTPP